MINLDYDKAVELLEEIVAEKGDYYVYTTDPKTFERQAAEDYPNHRCFYSNLDRTPGCIIGHLIHKLNPEFDLSNIERTGAGSAMAKAGINIGGAYSKVGILAVTVQSQQDMGQTWRTALDLGKDRCERKAKF